MSTGRLWISSKPLITYCIQQSVHIVSAVVNVPKCRRSLLRGAHARTTADYVVADFSQRRSALQNAGNHITRSSHCPRVFPSSPTRRALYTTPRTNNRTPKTVIINKRTYAHCTVGGLLQLWFGHTSQTHCM